MKFNKKEVCEISKATDIDHHVPARLCSVVEL
jgi:hypothetical protein